MIKIKSLLTQAATELPLKEWSDQEAFAKEQNKLLNALYTKIKQSREGINLFGSRKISAYIDKGNKVIQLAYSNKADRLRGQRELIKHGFKQSMIYKDISNIDKDYPYLLFLDGVDI